ncbi:hypothetical protein [Natrarchaeobius chitinivorans]|uniref:hypothetical protein n=1 Tax=Natrarchaeobius chitinivorans TaxID=1679083 RepID=UPI000F53836C|nr:hypothetical protein [Natrarchaeobius chitinivorans]
MLRIVLGLLYAVGALVHGYFALVTPDLYLVFADMALVTTYRELWLAVVVPNLGVLLPAVILLEAGIAVAILWRGRTVTVANLVGGCFQLGLVLSGPWGVINLGLAAVHFYLARLEFPRPAIPLNTRI